MNEVQALPIAELRRMIFDGEDVIHSMPDGIKRESLIATVKGLRSRLPLYAEHRWNVREWRARKARRPTNGPEVA